VIQRSQEELKGAVVDFCYLLDQAAAIVYWEVTTLASMRKRCPFSNAPT